MLSPFQLHADSFFFLRISPFQVTSPKKLFNISCISKVAEELIHQASEAARELHPAELYSQQL